MAIVEASLHTLDMASEGSSELLGAPQDQAGRVPECKLGNDKESATNRTVEQDSAVNEVK